MKSINFVKKILQYPGMKILVAEDEPMLLKTIELKLKKEGYEVIALPDGRDALAQLEKEMPDLKIGRAHV